MNLFTLAGKRLPGGRQGRSRLESRGALRQVGVLRTGSAPGGAGHSHPLPI